MKLKQNELRLSLRDKVVALKGHQDNDVFRVFSESIESHTSLTPQEKREIKEVIEKYPYIRID